MSLAETARGALPGWVPVILPKSLRLGLAARFVSGYQKGVGSSHR